jgi:ribose 5-phosphate isomerase B
MEQFSEKLVIGSDHAGFAMKEYIKSELSRRGIGCDDIGAHNDERSDYPLYAAKVARAVSKGEYRRGIAVCGSGIGASITANRFKGVRAALCITEEMARLSRQHNNANVLVIGGRITGQNEVSKILNAWLTTGFEGGRHENRIRMIDTEAEKGPDHP